MDVERERWRCCYDRIREALSEIGDENTWGEGDFWVVDGFSPGQQKVCITSWRMLSNLMLNRISSIVRSKFPEFEVFVQIEAKNEDGMAPMAGFIVRRDRIEDCLDRSLLPIHLRGYPFISSTN